jgi:hypothetical protein
MNKQQQGEKAFTLGEIFNNVIGNFACQRFGNLKSVKQQARPCMAKQFYCIISRLHFCFIASAHVFAWAF